MSLSNRRKVRCSGFSPPANAASRDTHNAPAPYVRLTPFHDRPSLARMKSLPIVWQRLVTSGGKTCDRCNATHRELQRAVSTLARVLRPLALRPTLKTRKLSRRLFTAHPSESNRVWIAGKPLEAWLGGRVGTSRCCSVCGDAPCRTVEVGGTVFEAIPQYLILKAALVAASSLLTPSPAEHFPQQRRKTRDTGRRFH